MTLSELTRRRDFATTSVAISAMPNRKNEQSVAKEANVAVANQLFPEEESAIRAWLAHIEETDHKTIGEIIAKCKTSDEARTYCLQQFKQIPRET